MYRRNILELCVQPLKDRVDEGVSESQGSSRKDVSDARFNVRVVSRVVSQHVHALRSQHVFHPVLVSDVLHLCSHYFASLVEEGVSVPVRVDVPQRLRHTVVFSQPYGVHRYQSDLHNIVDYTSLSPVNKVLLDFGGQAIF